MKAVTAYRGRTVRLLRKEQVVWHRPWCTVTVVSIDTIACSCAAIYSLTVGYDRDHGQSVRGRFFPNQGTATSLKTFLPG